MHTFNKTKTLALSLALIGASFVGSAFGDEKGAIKQPVKQAPVVQQPVKQQPVKQQPVKQQPVKQAPVAQQPVKQNPPVVPLPVKQAPPTKGPSTEEKWVAFFSLTHQANLYARNTIELARTTSDSEAVRNYATEMGKRLEQSDAALVASAEKFGYPVRVLNNKERIGMVLLARANGETELLRSLTGDAFNQEFLTRVVSCQGQAIRSLERRAATAPSAEMKAYFGEAIKNLSVERDTAQALLDKICDENSLR